MSTQTTPASRFHDGYADGAQGNAERGDDQHYLAGYRAGADANNGAIRPTFTAGLER